MSYCGSCNIHDAIFIDGVCQNCGNDALDELESAQKTLQAAKLGKRYGWTIYPNIEGWGDPIDNVIEECEERIKELQT